MGKSKLPIFRGNVERVITIYALSLTSIMLVSIIPSSPYHFSSSCTVNLIIVNMLSIYILYLPLYFSEGTALAVATFSASDRGLLVIACLAITSCAFYRWLPACLRQKLFAVGASSLSIFLFFLTVSTSL